MNIVKQAVEAYVKANQKDMGPHDRTRTVGGSEIGQCERKVWAHKMEGLKWGVERDPDYVENWGAQWRGQIIEKHFLVPAIKAIYPHTIGLGEDQQTLVDGLISATPDCFVLDRRSEFLIEFKSIDPRVRLQEPKPEHVYQVQVQMGILHARTKRRPRYAILAYVDASFLNEITEFQIDYDPDVYQRAKIRAGKILGALTMHELKPEGWIAGGKECEYCAFTRACGIARTAVPADDAIEPADPQLVAEISDMAKQLKVVEALLSSYEEDKRELQNDIKERMREKGLKRVVGEGVSITWTAVKGRDSWDMLPLLGAASDAGVEVETFKKPGEPGDRLTVTLKKSAAAA